MFFSKTNCILKIRRMTKVGDEIKDRENHLIRSSESPGLSKLLREFHEDQHETQSDDEEKEDKKEDGRTTFRSKSVRNHVPQNTTHEHNDEGNKNRKRLRAFGSNIKMTRRDILKELLAGTYRRRNLQRFFRQTTELFVQVELFGKKFSLEGQIILR